MIFETHAHYDDEAFDNDRDEILKFLPISGIEYVINIGSTIESINKIIELTKKYNYIYSAIGIHPDSTLDLNEEKFIWLSNNAKDKKCIAIGEIGLDYYWDSSPRNVQKEWFIKQIQLADELNLPIIVHSREAAKDTLDIIKDNKLLIKGGVMHCYSYSKEQAKQYLNLDFYFGIGGVVTFNNARKLKEVVEYIPIENIVLETDSPYLAPVPFRGKRNSSENLKLIAEEIGRIKDIDYEKVIDITYSNAKKLFFNESIREEKNGESGKS